MLKPPLPFFLALPLVLSITLDSKGTLIIVHAKEDYLLVLHGDEGDQGVSRTLQKPGSGYMESPLRHQPGLIKLDHIIPAETAIKRAIGDLDMWPLGLDAVDLNNLLERMFNNEPAVRHISPNDPPGKTLTNVPLNDAARARQEGNTDDPQAKAGRACTFHRKPPDIVLI